MTFVNTAHSRFFIDPPSLVAKCRFEPVNKRNLVSRCSADLKLMANPIKRLLAQPDGVIAGTLATQIDVRR